MLCNALVETILPKFKNIRVLDQRIVHDTGLYEDSVWALEYDTLEQKPRWQFTCLATAYAMIEAARGRQFRIGSHNWTDTTGIAAISGTGPGEQYSQRLHSLALVSTLMSGSCILANGSSPSLGHNGHWVLVVGYSKNSETNALGNFVAYDPYGGRKISIDATSWVAGGSLAGQFTASRVRVALM